MERLGAFIVAMIRFESGAASPPCAMPPRRQKDAGLFAGAFNRRRYMRDTE